MAASSMQLSMIDVPPPLPLPPLSTPSLASLFPEDPSLTESSFALSSVSRLNGPVEHPGHNLMNPSVGHRAPSRHGEERRRGGAGSSFTRRVRTAQSEPDLRGGGDGGGSGLGGSGLGGSGLGLVDGVSPKSSSSSLRSLARKPTSPLFLGLRASIRAIFVRSLFISGVGLGGGGLGLDGVVK